MSFIYFIRLFYPDLIGSGLGGFHALLWTDHRLVLLPHRGTAASVAEQQRGCIQQLLGNYPFFVRSREVAERAHQRARLDRHRLHVFLGRWGLGKA